MEIERIRKYYKARGLQWANPKDALWFFLSEVGELAEAYLSHYQSALTQEEIDMLGAFSRQGMQADTIVSRVPGWVRNNDRIRKENIEKEVADCNMMLSVFMFGLTGKTPDDALTEKMRDKLGHEI